MPKKSPLDIGHKVCSHCHIDKPIAEFHCYKYRTSAGNEGVRAHSQCRPCDRLTRNKAGDAVTLKRWRAANPDRVTQQRRDAQARPHRRATKARLQAMRKASQRAQTPYRHCPKVSAIYAEARRRRDAGEDVHVDHIKPLALGGEHRWENLQILPAVVNMRKGAKPHFAMTEEAASA